MFLAIINDTYSAVKEELSMKKSEFQLSDYIKKGYSKVLKKLHLKKEHIKDIQDALNTADVNQDKQLDWDEWRNDLRMRGIPDNEIEAVFAKYDIDGDMVLNEVEQRKLQEDLTRHRDEIDAKINSVDANAAAAVTTAGIADETDNPFVSGADIKPEDGAGGLTLSTATAGMQQNVDAVVDTLGNHFVAHEEFQLVSRRIDKLERSVGAVVTKIDGLIMKLETLDRINQKKLKSQQQQEKSMAGLFSKTSSRPGSSRSNRTTNKVNAAIVHELDNLSVGDSEVLRNQRKERLEGVNGRVPKNIPLGVQGPVDTHSTNIEQVSESRPRSRSKSRQSSASSKRPPTGKSVQ